MDREESFFPVKQSMPSVGSDDEESFVVLGSSSYNEDEVPESLNEEVLPPIRSNKVHEMQNLLKMEISQINSSSELPEMPSADTLKEVTSSVANITLSPDSSYEEIQKQVEELIKENEKLKNIIAQNNLSMKTQYDRILAWKEDVNSVMKSYKAKFVEAKSFIDKCKEENSKLANDVEKYKKIKELQDEEIINLKRKEKEMENEGVVHNSAEQNMIEFDLQIAKKKVEALKTALAEANLKNGNLTAENEKYAQKLVEAPTLEIKAKDEMIKSLQEQNIKLKNEIEKLCNLEIASQKSQHLAASTYEDKLKSNEDKIHQLEEETNNLKEEKICLSGQLDIVKAQLKKLQEIYDPNLQEEHSQLLEKLTHLQSTITALDEDNKKKIEEIEDLRVLLQNTSKNDEMFALNEQLTLFKTDFEAERESKNALKRERDRIAEDLENLQRRNNQLQNEIEVLRARVTERPKDDGYNCPKCSFGFTNYQSLENHVHRCLDLDGFP